MPGRELGSEDVLPSNVMLLNLESTLSPAIDPVGISSTIATERER